MMKVCVILAVFITIASAQDDGAILCSAGTCSDYVGLNPCPSIPESCTIQNETNNGIFLPSPDPCGCCQYCIENVGENGSCTSGESGTIIPKYICGPGLACLNSVCVKMAELPTPPPCSQAQADYDNRRKNGTLGSMELRPECDDDGYFPPYKCVPGQSCFCLRRNGSRIFGEIPFSPTADVTLRCGCSRKYYDVLKFFDRDSLYPNQHFRCTESGDYDSIQCIGEQCFCTDSLDGAPTFPDRGDVNMFNISNATLSDCFDVEKHEVGKFYHPCTEKYLALLDEVEDYKSKGYDAVFNINFPNCDLDGTYAPIQKNVSVNAVDDTLESYYYCANKDGTPIGTYRGTDASKMDCKCARSSLLIPEQSNEKPQCCQNGNFNKVQCRRGQCYCVDVDGYQDASNSNGKVIEVTENQEDQLFCYTQADQDQCLGVSVSF